MASIVYQGKYKDDEGNMFIAITDATYMKDGSTIYIVTRFSSYNVGNPVALDEEEFSKLTFLSY